MGEHADTSHWVVVLVVAGGRVCVVACRVGGGGSGDGDADDDFACVFSLSNASIILSFTASSFSSVGTSRPLESFWRYQGNWMVEAAG